MLRSHFVVKGRLLPGSRAFRCGVRGFALPELVLLIAVIAAAAAILMVAANRSNRLASLAESLANLKRFGEGTTSYAADNQDLIFSFSWRQDRIGPTTFADLREQARWSDLDAQSAQAIDILRRRTGRSDIDLLSGWLACANYTHLVLADYYAESLPSFWMISPEDKNRLLWAGDPLRFQAGGFVPSPNPPSVRWPYSSSYERPLCVSTWDYLTPTRGTITNSGSHNLYQAVRASGGGAPNYLADRRLAEVAYPSHKAIGWDSAQRHHGTTDQFFLYADARVPVLTVDGAVRVRTTGNANRGVDPASPRSTFPLYINYLADVWEPLPRPGSTSLAARYRFTRSGLAGRDFDADEVPVP